MLYGDDCLVVTIHYGMPATTTFSAAVVVKGNHRVIIILACEHSKQQQKLGVAGNLKICAAYFLF